MGGIKKQLKNILQKTAGAALSKTVHYRIKRAAHYYQNQRFRKNNPGIAIPPDEWLFETFQLDYQQYFQDGQLAAKEIWNWTAPYLQAQMPTVLDWGCGTGRIIQHLHQQNAYSLLYGADINESMIKWNHQHIKDVHFTKIKSDATTDYPPNYFHLVYGISVFTHISLSLQMGWIQELHRIIQNAGILLVTTHGSFFTDQLNDSEKKQLLENGSFEKPFGADNSTQSGDRNYTVYESADQFNKMIADYFLVLSHFDGKESPEKFGGQDLWILQKK